MEKKQSFVKEENDDFEVLMEGSKSFWKLRLSLDILIISHPGQKCIELVAYNTEIGVEAPRIYISSVLLATKINPDKEDFEEKLKTAQEVFLRQKKTCTDADLRKQVYNELVVSYIMQRLNVVTEDIDLTKELRVQLSCISPRSCISSIRSVDVCEKARQIETQGDNQDVICSMPEHLHPVKATFTKIAR
jgi:hypothetical protein